MINKMKTKNVPLDILILTYNGLANTKECIEALYKYTTNFNLTIIDNASTDGTPRYLFELAESHNNITLECQEKNLGVVKGRNYAYDICKNVTEAAGGHLGYIMFLDNDQIVREHWQEIYSHALEGGFGERRYDIVGAEAWQMDKHYYPKYRCRHWDEEFDYVGCGGMMIRNKVIEDIGLFDKRFSPMYFEDPDFCWRALASEYRITWRHNTIFHKPHKLLKKEPERTKMFMSSLSKFRKKHFNTPLPRLSVPVPNKRIRVKFY